MSTTKLRSSTQLYIDANLDLNSKKITSLSAGTTTGQAVEYDQMNTAIANAISSGSSALHPPVADVTAAKAITSAVYIDKMMMLIETTGLYRFDAESMYVSDDSKVIRPTDIASDSLPGRWVQMTTSITPDVASILAAATPKTALVDADTLPVTDSEASSALKKTTWSNIKSLLKTYFDTLYNPKLTEVFGEVPTGTVNGSNVTFTIAHLVISGTERIYKNGYRLKAASDADYTISYGATTTITFTVAPSASGFTDTLLVDYKY